MNGYRFYADAGAERSKSASKKHCAFTRANLREWARNGIQCNVVAVLLPEREHGWISNGEWIQEALVATFYHENSDTSCSGVAHSYLRKHCVRIDETLARLLHPVLFQRLDMADA